MFKHIIKGLLCLIFMWSFLLPASAENSAGTPPDITADSAIVINADTGTAIMKTQISWNILPV